MKEENKDNKLNNYEYIEEKFSLNEMILEGIRIFEIDLKSFVKELSFVDIGLIDKKEDTKNYINALPETFIKKFQAYLKEPRFNGKSYRDITRDDTYAKESGKNYHGNTKNFFTKTQVEEILFSSEIYDFLNQYSTNKKPSSKEVLMEVSKEKLKWDKFVKDSNLPSDEYFPIYPSQEMLMLEEMKLMIEGIFDIFYEPIDFKTLNSDKEYVQSHSGNRANILSKTLADKLENIENYLTRRSLDEIKRRLNKTKN